MTIEGTQVPMYTKHTLFLYFSDFSIFFFNFYMKKNKTENNKQKHVKKSKAKNQTNSKIESTHISNANKNKKREKKVIESLGALFLPQFR